MSLRVERRGKSALAVGRETDEKKGKREMVQFHPEGPGDAIPSTIIALVEVVAGIAPNGDEVPGVVEVEADLDSEGVSVRTEAEAGASRRDVGPSDAAAIADIASRGPASDWIQI